MGGDGWDRFLVWRKGMVKWWRSRDGVCREELCRRKEERRFMCKSRIIRSRRVFLCEYEGG